MTDDEKHACARAMTERPRPGDGHIERPIPDSPWSVFIVPTKVGRRFAAQVRFTQYELDNFAPLIAHIGKEGETIAEVIVGIAAILERDAKAVRSIAVELRAL